MLFAWSSSHIIRVIAELIILPLATLLIGAMLFSSLGSAEPLGGQHGEGHKKLHHWYQTLRQPGTGYSCCDGKDCRPTSARVRGNIIEVLVDGEWTRVPVDKILARPSPDMNTHVCAPKGPWSPKVIFCVVFGFGV